jgi:hypothetical protein
MDRPLEPITSVADDGAAAKENMDAGSLNDPSSGKELVESIIADRRGPVLAQAFSGYK